MGQSNGQCSQALYAILPGDDLDGDPPRWERHEEKGERERGREPPMPPGGAACLVGDHERFAFSWARALACGELLSWPAAAPMPGGPPTPP